MRPFFAIVPSLPGRKGAAMPASADKTLNTFGRISTNSTKARNRRSIGGRR